MGLGLGAENVVGYSIMTEFFPVSARGRWSGFIATVVTSGLPSRHFWPGFWCRLWLACYVRAWRAGGIYCLVPPPQLPESPRWLVTVGPYAGG